jgi:hypothetical protein
MLIIIVFIVSFLVFFGLSIIFPIMPPGQLICEVFGNGETGYTIAGVSGELILSSIVNGVVWGAILIIVYSSAMGPSRKKTHLPVWLPGYATSRNSKKQKEAPNKYASQGKAKTEDIETIEGIGSVYASRLRKLGIRTVNDLINAGFTKTGRIYLANNIGVNHKTILYWVHQAEARNSTKFQKKS